MLRDLHISRTGKMNAQELVEKCRSEKFQAQLAVLGLDIKDGSLFEVVLHTITEDGHIGIETFMQVCMRMKGAATRLDSQGMLLKM